MKRITLILSLMISVCAARGADGISVGLILPFDIDSGANVSYMDFYSGTLVAADSLCARGIDVTIKVMDCFSGGRYSGIDEEMLEGCNLLIGPISSAQMTDVAFYSALNGVPLVSPLDVRTAPITGMNPFFFLVPTPLENRIANLVSSVAGSRDGDITVFHNPASADDRQLRSLVEKALDEEGLTYSEVSYGILEGREITSSLRKRMDSLNVQKVIIASEDEAFASDVMRNLNLIKLSGLDVMTFGSYRLRSFETIDPETFYNVNFHASTPYWVDYSDERTRNFVAGYRSTFNCEPTPYAFQGYDILMYFGSMMSELGDGFCDFIEYYPASLLQNSFHFKRSDGESGFVNTATRNLDYSRLNRSTFSISLK